MRIDHQPAITSRGNGAPVNREASAPGTPAFADVLASVGGTIQLSRHAQKRVDRRDLNLDAARLQRLDSAITRAAEKGSRNSVVMLDELAMVVDVRGRTVITAMPREGEGPKVFTNIDSVVIA